MDKVLFDLPTLRRDLYTVMSLLLADKQVAAVKLGDWVSGVYEAEVRRLLLWVAAACRNLQEDLTKDDFSKRSCGEYWKDSECNEEKSELTFRQACNSIIHAKEILPYLPPKSLTVEEGKAVYGSRVAIRGLHNSKSTLAQLDIIKFARIADDLIKHFIGGRNHADRQNCLQIPFQAGQ